MNHDKDDAKFDGVNQTFTRDETIKETDCSSKFQRGLPFTYPLFISKTNRIETTTKQEHKVTFQKKHAIKLNQKCIRIHTTKVTAKKRLNQLSLRFWWSPDFNF